MAPGHHQRLPLLAVAAAAALMMLTAWADPDGESSASAASASSASASASASASPASASARPLVPSLSAAASSSSQSQYGSSTTAPSEHHISAEGAGVAHEFLEAHNQLRAKYDMPPLRWSSKLAKYARRWSSVRRFDCTMMHSQNSPYGENVFWGTGSDWRAADAVKSWASEGSYFDWRSQACHPGKVCGHFTQLVWNDTQYVGCGRAECFNGGVFITCSYDPPGNWKGEVPLT